MIEVFLWMVDRNFDYDSFPTYLYDFHFTLWHFEVSCQLKLELLQHWFFSVGNPSSFWDLATRVQVDLGGLGFLHLNLKNNIKISHRHCHQNYTSISRSIHSLSF